MAPQAKQASRHRGLSRAGRGVWSERQLVLQRPRPPLGLTRGQLWCCLTFQKLDTSFTGAPMTSRTDSVSHLATSTVISLVLRKDSKK